jgi:hypothetical protein
VKARGRPPSSTPSRFAPCETYGVSQPLVASGEDIANAAPCRPASGGPGFAKHVALEASVCAALKARPSDPDLPQVLRSLTGRFCCKSRLLLAANNGGVATSR